MPVHRAVMNAIIRRAKCIVFDSLGRSQARLAIAAHAAKSAFYFRMRAQVSSGQGHESGGLIESTRQFFISESIFANGFQ